MGRFAERFPPAETDGASRLTSVGLPDHPGVIRLCSANSLGEREKMTHRAWSRAACVHRAGPDGGLPARTQPVNVRSVPPGPPGSVRWCPSGRLTKAVACGGTATVTESRGPCRCHRTVICP